MLLIEVLSFGVSISSYKCVSATNRIWGEEILTKLFIFVENISVVSVLEVAKFSMCSRNLLLGLQNYIEYSARESLILYSLFFKDGTPRSCPPPLFWQEDALFLSPRTSTDSVHLLLNCI